jgi:hypothetical protein
MSPFLSKIYFGKEIYGSIIKRGPTMAESIGIPQSKEAIIGMMELALLMAEVLKDGAQLSDLGIVWAKMSSDKRFKEKMRAALDKIGEVPKEMGDLSLPEGMELAMLLIPYVPRFVDVFKGK